MGQITATRNLVAIKVVRHAGQKATLFPICLKYISKTFLCETNAY